MSNILLNILLVRRYGHIGLALATALTGTITAVLLLYELRKKIGPLGLSAMLQSSLKIAGSSMIMGVIVYITYNYSMFIFEPSRLFELLILLITVGIGLLVYLGFLYLLKVEELQFLLDSVKNRLS